MLLTVVFLGFTITLLAFREWMSRSWAIRVMDQYANDLVSQLDTDLRLATNVTQNPPQYGLGSFSIWLPQYNFDFAYNPFGGLSRRTYSARPTQGVYVALDNTAPQKFDPGFPPTGWQNSHRIFVDEFQYIPYVDPNRMPLFNQSMVQIQFTLRYERPRTVEIPDGGTEMREYVFLKQYKFTTFMKNYINNLVE